MRVRSIDIQNFRKLHSVRIDLADETTLFVGANNSGKTTVMVALRRFLADGRGFSIRDFTLSNIWAVNAIGESWEAGKALNAEACFTRRDCPLSLPA